MKLKEDVLHLLFAFAGVLFIVHANSLIVQKIILKTDLDPQIGESYRKGPPGILTVDFPISRNLISVLVTRLTTRK